MSGTDWLPYAQELACTLEKAGCLKPEWLRDALLKTPRHLFIDQYYDDCRADEPQLVGGDSLTDAQAKAIYTDAPLLIRKPPDHCSSSQPQIIFAMLSDLQVKPGNKVLEIGTGTGWDTALLAHGVGDDSLVYSVDIQPDLVDAAKAHMASVGCAKARLRAGDGGYGWPEAAPFDRIIVTVGSPDIPVHWLEQIADGGILLLPLEIPGHGNPVLRIRKSGGMLTGEFTRWSGFYRCQGDFSALPTESGPRPPCPPDRSPDGIKRVSLWEMLCKEFLFFLHTNRMPIRCALECQLLRDIGLPLSLESQSAGLADHHQPVLYLCGDYRCGEILVGHQEDWIALGRPGITDYKVEVVPADSHKPTPGELVDVRPSAALKLSLREMAASAHAI